MTLGKGCARVLCVLFLRLFYITLKLFQIKIKKSNISEIFEKLEAYTEITVLSSEWIIFIVYLTTKFDTLIGDLSTSDFADYFVLTTWVFLCDHYSYRVQFSQANFVINTLSSRFRFCCQFSVSHHLYCVLFIFVSFVFCCLFLPRGKKFAVFAMISVISKI